jgi:small-conductance mechanosensitive channel
VNQAHMAEQVAEQMAKVKRHARPWRSIFAALVAVLMLAGSVLAREGADEASDKLPLELLSAGFAAGFFLFAFSATLGLSGRARELLLPRIGNAHATMVRLLLVLVGGLATLVLTLQLFRLPVGQLVLGGALTGVLVGIAAQQTLANLFAGIILLLSRPFVVGDDVRLWSGPLGGEFEGTVMEIGLTYVRLAAPKGEFRLPNAQVLSSAVGPTDRSEPGPGRPEGDEADGVADPTPEPDDAPPPAETAPRA